MLKKQERTVMHSYPGMVAIVSVRHNGKENAMAAGWHSYISYEPPIYGVAIGRERFTYNLMKEAGEFTISFLPFELAEKIQLLGTLSGEEVDKFKELGLQTLEASVVNAPILKAAYVAYECQVRDVQTYGDHDWFVGDMVAFYRNEEFFLENGLPDLEKLQIPLYLGRSLYGKFDGDVKLIDTYK